MSEPRLGYEDQQVSEATEKRQGESGTVVVTMQTVAQGTVVPGQLTGDRYDYSSTSKIESDPVNIANLEVSTYDCVSEVKTIYLKNLWDLILHETVPVSLSAVAVLGLPHCGKSEFIKQVFLNKVQLKMSVAEDAVERHMQYTNDDSGLSVHTLCVLGGQHYGEAAWSLTSRRFGITYSVISSIIWKLKLQMFSLDRVKFQQIEPPYEECIKDKNSNRHLAWIFNQVQKLLKEIKNDESKQKLLSGGFSLVNVFDAGMNKAVYDFLPFLANYCDNLIRIVMFSMERDSECLSKPPHLGYAKYEERGDNRLVMQWRPRLNYLIHFASVGYQPDLQPTEGDSIFIGSWKRDMPQTNEASPSFQGTKQKLLELAKKYKLHWITDEKHWIEMCLSQSDSMKRGCASVEEIISEKSEYKLDLPVKWMFLRSLLSSHKTAPIIFEMKVITYYASFLGIEGNEFDKFLGTFVNYGSMIHFSDFPKLQHYVITNIYEFTRSLGKLYYPATSSIDNPDQLLLHSRYGILTEEYLQSLFSSDRTVPLIIFMEIITELGMVVKIKKSKSIKADPDSNVSLKLERPEICYFLPSARVKDCSHSSSKEIHSSVYMHIQSAQFPANVQTNVASAMIESQDMVMVACDISNVMYFESTNGKLKLKFSYFGEETEIQILKTWDRNEADELDAIVRSLGIILDACCIAMTKRQNQIRALIFKLGVKCVCNQSKYHYLFYETGTQLCEQCQTVYANCEEIQLWITAATKCQHLVEDDTVRMKRAFPLKRDDLFHVTEHLEADKDLTKRVAEKLVEESDLQCLKQKHKNEEINDWRFIIDLFFKWEEKEKNKNNYPSRQSLAKILKDEGAHKDIWYKLDPELMEN